MTTPTGVSAELLASADALRSIFDRIEVDCNWRINSEEREEIAKADKILRASAQNVSVPDWKQDQAETTRIKPGPSDTVPDGGRAKTIREIMDRLSGCSFPLIVGPWHEETASLIFDTVVAALSPDTEREEITVPSSDNMAARFAWLQAKAIDMGYVLVPESEHPDSPHATTPSVSIGVEEIARVAAGLRVIAGITEHWREYDKKSRDREGISTTDSTSIMCPPYWPSHGQLKTWEKTLHESVAILSALSGTHGENDSTKASEG